MQTLGDNAATRPPAREDPALSSSWAFVAESPAGPHWSGGVLPAIRAGALWFIGSRDGYSVRLTLASELGACRRCDLWEGAETAAPGEGNPEARLVLVCDQPEDETPGGLFNGPMGMLLDELLEGAGTRRDSIFLTTAVRHFKWIRRNGEKYRVTPSAHQISACSKWLQQEVRELQPEVVVALGSVAARSVLGRYTTVKASRGAIFAPEAIPYLIVTYHPSAVLHATGPRRRKLRSALASDLLQAVNRVGTAPPTRSLTGTRRNSVRGDERPRQRGVSRITSRR